MNMKKRVSELKSNDNTPWYTIIKVEKKDGKIIAEIRYNDGGTAVRIWDDPNSIILLI